VFLSFILFLYKIFAEAPSSYLFSPICSLGVNLDSKLIHWLATSANTPKFLSFNANFIQVDGWGSPDVLQGGTGSECIVSSGKIQSQTAFGWFEWYPYSWTDFSDFSVKPGDSMNCLVCAPAGAGATTGSVFLSNTSTGQYVSAQPTAPSGTKLVGNCAEWIMEDPSLGGTEAPFPDYGAEFFYDCLAGTAKDVEKNLSGATLLNLVEGSATLSTAVEESNTILMTYSGTSGP
jgi:hypothetical protein